MQCAHAVHKELCPTVRRKTFRSYFPLGTFKNDPDYQQGEVGKNKGAFVRKTFVFHILPLFRAGGIARFESVSESQLHHAMHGHYGFRGFGKIYYAFRLHYANNSFGMFLRMLCGFSV